MRAPLVSAAASDKEKGKNFLTLRAFAPTPRQRKRRTPPESGGFSTSCFFCLLSL